MVKNRTIGGMTVRKLKHLFKFKSIKAKILFGFSIIIILVFGLGIYNFIAVNTINTNIKEVVNEQLPLLIADEKITYNVAQQLASVRGYLLFGEPDFKEEFNKHAEESKKYKQLILEKYNSEEVRQLIEKTNSWTDIIVNEVFSLHDVGKVLGAKEVMKEKVVLLSEEIINDYVKLAENREKLIDKEGYESVSIGNTILWIGTIVTIFLLILGISVSVIISQRISSPIRKIMEQTKRIANGDVQNRWFQLWSS